MKRPCGTYLTARKREDFSARPDFDLARTERDDPIEDQVGDFVLGQLRMVLGAPSVP